MTLLSSKAQGCEFVNLLLLLYPFLSVLRRKETFIFLRVVYPLSNLNLWFAVGRGVVLNMYVAEISFA